MLASQQREIALLFRFFAAPPEKFRAKSVTISCRHFCLPRCAAGLSEVNSGMVQLVARGPLEPKILVRVQVPEPFLHFPR